MRDAFPGRYRPSKEDFDRLWEEGILVLDANVLLNLYRYSGDTREQMIAVLRGLKDRLWLPHQVAREFLDRRLGVIHNKRRSYEALREYLDNARAEAEQRLEGLHRDPITEAEDVLERVRDSLRELTDRLKEREEDLPKETNSPQNDPVWRVVDELYAGKVGSPYPDEKKKEIFEKGRKRYGARVPPATRTRTRVVTKTTGARGKSVRTATCWFGCRSSTKRRSARSRSCSSPTTARRTGGGSPTAKPSAPARSWSKRCATGRGLPSTCTGPTGSWPRPARGASPPRR